MTFKCLSLMLAVPMLALPLAAQQAAPGVSGPVQVPAKVMKKLKISGSDPEMPGDLDLNTATVDANVFIGPDGKVERVEATKGPDAAKDIVVSALEKWKYKPYMVDGKPVEAETTVEIYMTKD